jgi:hypothetical protein
MQYAKILFLVWSIWINYDHIMLDWNLECHIFNANVFIM